MPSVNILAVRHALLFLLLILSAMPVRADKLKDALGLLWSGKIEQGLKAVRSLAEQGDVQAQLFLGRSYSHENSIEKHPDYQESMKWFKRASGQGSGEASAGIAELYEQGHGVPKSSKEAMVWWNLAAKQGYDQQELDVRCFTRTPRTGRLTCNPRSDGGGCPTPSEMAALRTTGLTGILSPGGGGVRYRLGPKARALIVLDHRITSELRLKQPRHTNVIYVQRETGWLRLPENAPLLDRPIILSPQSGASQYIMVGVQDADGSVTSAGCAVWK
jgi:Sel1 repeat